MESKKFVVSFLHMIYNKCRILSIELKKQEILALGTDVAVGQLQECGGYIYFKRKGHET